MSNQNQYFATKSSADLIEFLKGRRERFFKHKEKTGEVKKWKKAYSLYYGEHVKDADSSDPASVGDDGELTAYGTNYYRSLIQHILALTCSQKPAYDYRAKNTDLRSLQQAKLANNIVDSYLVEKRMYRHMKQAAERALVFKTGFIHTQWDTTLGRAVTTAPVLNPDQTPKLDENNQPVRKQVHEGDPSLISKSPWEVVYDRRLRDWSKCKDVEVKEYENKYDLAAQYPDKAEEILKVCDKDDKDVRIGRIFDNMDDEDESGIIPVYYYYHIPTAAAPAGRFLKYIGDKVALFDGPYNYPAQSGNHKLPVQRIAPGEMFDTADGYSQFHDIMVLQKVLNILMSTAFTNQKAFGTQAVWMPDGCNISGEELNNLVVLKGGMPGSEPKAINLTATPAEIFKNAEYVEAAMSKLVGLNDVVTGNAPQDLSGAAIGRYQSMAIQYNTNFQQSWAEVQEDSGTFMLFLLQNFANTKRMAALAGKSNRGAMVSWSGKDIDMIDRLICDLGNPLFRTYTGRQDTADKLMEKGLVKDVSQYMQILETGQLDPMLEGPTSKLELIRKENEMMLEGKPALAMVGDSHIQHVQEHRVIMDDPQIRAAAAAGDEFAVQIIKVVTEHITQHQQIQQTQDLFWFQVSGEPPPMLPAGGPQPVNGQGGPPPPPQGPPPEGQEVPVPAEAPPPPPPAPDVENGLS